MSIIQKGWFYKELMCFQCKTIENDGFAILFLEKWLVSIITIDHKKAWFYKEIVGNYDQFLSFFCKTHLDGQTHYN